MSDMMIKKLLVRKSLIKINEHPSYVGDFERKVLLNSTDMVRAAFDPRTGEYSFQGKLATQAHNPMFVPRNFTEAEIAYCRSQPSPPSSFAARWVDKEAVFKTLCVKSKGAA